MPVSQPPMPHSAYPNRDNAFSHLRLVAAPPVLYSHHFALWGQSEPQALGLTLGLIGVSLLFGISGYLVTQSLMQDA